MLKIKTITCHEVYNHGASLQEYALLAFLNYNGFESEAINYKPLYLSGHFNLMSVSNPKFNFPLIKQLYLLVKLPGRLKSLKRKKSFDTFHAKYIPTGRILYRNNNELKQNPPEADVFICGSDQIWNSFFKNGKDPAFYLNFVPDGAKKISYAPSFAIEKLSDEVKPLVRENVSKFDAVSVRETSGVRILNELGIDNVVQVLDPVFLMDASYWRKKFISPVFAEYVFVYDFDNNEEIKKISEKLRREKGFKIFTVNERVKYADKNYFLEGPERFLSLIQGAQYVISNSFHAVAFSLILEKQFVVFNRKESINTRMKDLLDIFNLGNRLISSTEEFYKLIDIKYSEINDIKDFHITKSKQFLLDSLSSN